MNPSFRIVILASLLFVLSVRASADSRLSSPYPWLDHAPADTIENRFTPPEGFARPAAEDKSFAAWLRGLPLLPGRPKVLLFDGREKGNQDAHDAVVDMDVGNRDLQQCADAVMRLRAEYLRAVGRADRISFRFTSGAPAKWAQWRRGMRPHVSGNKVVWKQTSRPAADYTTFRRYLTKVFQYAGTASLSRELIPVAAESKIAPGDVFIEGGFPGHAVIVVDTAESNTGDRVFLLAQSYMPAQQVHILKNPTDPDLSPWYRYRPGALRTPEWQFAAGTLKRFSN